MTALDLRTARSFDELANDMKNTRVNIRVLSGFIMQGREPAKVGEEMLVSRSFAAELVGAEKAEIIPLPPPKPDPNLMPQFESTPTPVVDQTKKAKS